MENPDGGVDLLYLVCETKGTLDLDALRSDEKRKILCGRKDFRDTLEMGLTGYHVITEAGQLPAGACDQKCNALTVLCPLCREECI